MFIILLRFGVGIKITRRFLIFFRFFVLTVVRDRFGLMIERDSTDVSFVFVYDFKG